MDLKSNLVKWWNSTIKIDNTDFLIFNKLKKSNAWVLFKRHNAYTVYHYQHIRICLSIRASHNTKILKDIYNVQSISPIVHKHSCTVTTISIIITKAVKNQSLKILMHQNNFNPLICNFSPGYTSGNCFSASLLCNCVQFCPSNITPLKMSTSAF